MAALLEATHDAFPRSPAFDPASPSDFQAYWRDVLSRLHDSVVSDPKIPDTLTLPLRKKFTIKLFDAHHILGCACSLPKVEPTITLENEDGITKGDFVRGLASYLYGESLPVVNRAHVAEGTAPETKTGALAYSPDWMSSGAGGIYAYDGDYKYMVPNIWMYCCRWDEFERKQGNEKGEGKDDDEDESPKVHVRWFV